MEKATNALFKEKIFKKMYVFKREFGKKIMYFPYNGSLFFHFISACTGQYLRFLLPDWPMSCSS
jgi:hypothetical protein